MSFLSAAIIGGAGIASAVIGSHAAQSAANTQAQSAANALAFQNQVYNRNQSNLQPFIGAGTNATYTMSRLLGGQGTPADYSSFYNSPDYLFAQQQGELGITRAANARGMNLSGGTLKDLVAFNSGLASQQYGNYFNRLMGMAGMGANAAGGLATNNTQAGSNIANTTMAQGQAQASGTVGAANAITGGINSGISNALLYNALNRNQNASAYSSSGSGSTGAGSFNPFNTTGSLY